MYSTNCTNYGNRSPKIGSHFPQRTFDANQDLLSQELFAPIASFVLPRSCDALLLTKCEKKRWVLLPDCGIQVSGGPSSLPVYFPRWIRLRASEDNGAIGRKVLGHVPEFLLDLLFKGQANKKYVSVSLRYSYLGFCMLLRLTQVDVLLC